MNVTTQLDLIIGLCFIALSVLSIVYWGDVTGSEPSELPVARSLFGVMGLCICILGFPIPQLWHRILLGLTLASLLGCIVSAVFRLLVGRREEEKVDAPGRIQHVRL